MNINCKNCNSKFKVKPSRLKRNPGYCSVNCYYKSKKGMVAWNKGKIAPWAIGNKNMSGKIAWNKGKNTPEHVKLKISLTSKKRKHSLETRLLMSKSHRKIRENNHLWKGGLTEKSKSIRNGIDYRLWREAVFSRDNFICQECGERGGRLNAHHIKPFSLFPELRFAIDNGMTLCQDCHKNTDSYGNRVKNKICALTNVPIPVIEDKPLPEYPINTNEITAF